MLEINLNLELSQRAPNLMIVCEFLTRAHKEYQRHLLIFKQKASIPRETDVDDPDRGLRFMHIYESESSAYVDFE